MQVLTSVEERSSIETLSQLVQMKLLFLFVCGLHLTYIHSGEKYWDLRWKSSCMGVNKLSSIEKLAIAIDFEAQMK